MARRRSTTHHAPRTTHRSASARHSTADLLFEIGTEELPAAYLPGLIDQLGREAKALLDANGLRCQRIERYGAPRRLVVLVRGLAATQRKPAEEIRGPSRQAAYAGDGQPTPALLGFLRSRGGSLRQTKLVASEKGEYVYLVKPPTETPTARVLPDLLPQLIGRLRAPKTMRWEAGGARFARPIRWLLALYGASPIRCEFGALRSAPHTRLGRPMALRRMAVRSVDGYLRLLSRAGIILDHARRHGWIQRTVARLAKQAGGRPAPETSAHGLLDEVTHLVEQPAALIGAFDPKYLQLPREVLLASMAKYQRVFALQKASGALLPRFVAILEGRPGQPSAVRQAMERILNARLADSFLFWTEDRREPLTKGKDLSGVTFHERLGSMEDKTSRLRQLALTLEEAWKLSDVEREQLRRACVLSKTDLVTRMVREFPTLQGIMGKHYALASTPPEPRPVAEAIEEHYLPLAGRLPKTLLGSALALLDKYDTLASYFSIGIEPTGDQDPFGLRRAAQGIVEVAWATHRPVPFGPLFQRWQAGAAFAKGPAGSGARLREYLLERLYTFAWTAPAPTADCIDAVLSGPREDLIDVMDRIVGLSRLHGHNGLLRAAKVIERTRNILKGAILRQDAVDPGRLQDPLEERLWKLCSSEEARRVIRLAEQKAYAEATTLFGDLFFEPLHEFFDRVLVNAPDPAVQQNRLALMRAIHTLYTERIADLSKLTIVQRAMPAPPRARQEESSP